MKIAVFGTRSLNDSFKSEILTQFNSIVAGYKNANFYTLLHGGAEGPQKVLASALQDNLNVDIVLFKPWHMVWSKLAFEPTLFYLRNKQLVENADVVIIYDNGDKDSEVYRVKALCDRKEIKYHFVSIDTSK